MANPAGNDPQLVRKILIGDFAPLKFEALIRDWKKQNVAAETATQSEVYISRLGAEHFDVTIVNLLLGGIGPNKLIADVRKASKNKDIKVVVISKQVHRVNIENAIDAGADDFVAEPFENEDVFNRILYHLTPKTVVEKVGLDDAAVGAKHAPFIKLLLQSVETLSRTGRHKAHHGILAVLQKSAELLGSNRTSLIMVESKTTNGMVLASSDDPSFQDFPIHLSKYPEVQHVVNTGTIVLVDDVDRSALTQKIKDNVKSISIGSIMVFPVRFQDEVVGVLVIRRPKAKELPPMEVLSVIQALANILASHSNVKMTLRKIYSDFASNG